MKYSESLKKHKDFELVYKEHNSLANRFLVMYIRDNGYLKNRIGISVSKKVGNSVVRHRITRLIRESYRLNETLFRRSIDIVVVARKNAKDISYEDIKNSLIHLGGKHNIIIKEQEC